MGTTKYCVIGTLFSEDNGMQCESATANSTVLRSVYSYPLDCFQSEKGISAMNLSQETRLGWCLPFRYGK